MLVYSFFTVVLCYVGAIPQPIIAAAAAISIFPSNPSIALTVYLTSYLYGLFKPQPLDNLTLTQASTPAWLSVPLFFLFAFLPTPTRPPIYLTFFVPIILVLLTTFNFSSKARSSLILFLALIASWLVLLPSSNPSLPLLAALSVSSLLSGVERTRVTRTQTPNAVELLVVSTFTWLTPGLTTPAVMGSYYSDESDYRSAAGAVSAIVEGYCFHTLLADNPSGRNALNELVTSFNINLDLSPISFFSMLLGCLLVVSTLILLVEPPNPPSPLFSASASVTIAVISSGYLTTLSAIIICILFYKSIPTHLKSSSILLIPIMS